MRLRVAIDITKPLCRGQRITMARGMDGWGSFKYEQLPIICYRCGRLTHSDRDCNSRVKIKGPQNVRDKQFGTWLHATTPHPSRKSVIQVEVYEEDSGDEGVVDTGINANDQRGDLNAGVMETGSAKSEEGRQSILASDPGRRVD